LQSQRVVSGGGGNRTPVRKCVPERVYERSRRFVVTALAPTGGLSRGHPAKVLGDRLTDATATQPEL